MSSGLEARIEAAISAASWIAETTDGPTIELAYTYARAIDNAVETAAPPDLVKALYLGPHLSNVLKTLGFAPAERLALVGVEKPKSKRDELREKREAKRAEAAGGSTG